MLATVGFMAAALGAHAAMITQEQSYFGETDWTQDLTFSQFNTALGTLNSVDITLTGAAQLTTSAQNNSAGSMYVRVTDDLTLSSTVPDSSPLTLAKTLAQSFSVPVGQTVNLTTTGTVSDNQTYNSGLAAWEGVGTIILAGEADDSISSSISGGNYNVSFTTTAGLDAVVTYNYTAVPDGPVPWWASLGAIGGVCWLAAGHKPRRPVAAV